MSEDQLPIEAVPGEGAKRRPTAEVAPNKRRRAPANRLGEARVDDPGADLERRVARVEFADGAFVRVRAPIRVDADSGRDVLTDIDVLALDVDGRLRVSRSILECKSGRGQAGEPDRLLWLAGLQKYLRFDRAVLVRQTVSRRGEALARALGLRILDVRRLAVREAAHAWLPQRFAHVGGTECRDAESRSDTQLRGLPHVSADLVSFLRNEALRREPHEALRAIAALGRAVASGGVLPSPTREVLAAHSLIALLVAAITDAGRLDELTPEDLTESTALALTTGSADGARLLAVLSRADALMRHMQERIHQAYADAGARQVQVEVPSLVGLVQAPPPWIPHYVELVKRLRANPAISREILQTAELACFDALVGGQSFLEPAFDHLFASEHRYLLNAALRCLGQVAGDTTASALAAVMDLDYTRGLSPRGDRSAPAQVPTPSSAKAASKIVRPVIDDSEKLS